MSKRTERRAAERETRKLAYQQLRQAQTQQSEAQQSAVIADPLTADPENTDVTDLLARAQAFFDAKPTTTAAEPEGKPEQNTISDAQLKANRANAKLSSGPVSSEGRAKSSMNALRHGLTAKTVVLAGEDSMEYERQLNAYIDQHAPATDEELRLVQSLLDCIWRLNRVHRLESAIFLKGEIEFAGKFEDRTPIEQRHLIQAEAYLKYEKSIRNLNIQEARLRRTMEKDRAELQRLQAIRKREELMAAEVHAQQGQTRPIARTHAANGFDFSTQLNGKPASGADRCLLHPDGSESGDSSIHQRLD